MVFSLSCQIKNESNEKNKILDAKSVIVEEKIDTIRINSNSDFLFKVLSMIPDSAMGAGHDWTMLERKEEYDNALKGFCINRGEDGFHHKRIINNTHLFVKVVDSYWQLKIYEMNDIKIVLAHAHCGDGDEFYAYKFENEIFYPIGEFFPLDYLELFFKEPQSLLDYDNREQPGYFEMLLDFEIEGDNIIARNYYAKEDSILFVGNIQVLGFNKLTGKMESKKVFWGNIKN